MIKCLKKGNNDFVFLGRLVSDKGVDLAIEAIAILNSENKNYKLTIIGDGPELQKLIMQAADLGISEHVTFLGSLKGGALVEHLKQHQFMLIPSRWKEPFGVVALEAIACGCIPIVSDGGGLPDAVGNAGLVFQRGSLVDLVNKIRTLLKDSILRGKLIEAGPVHLASHHPDAIAKKYLSLLKGAINKYSNS